MENERAIEPGTVAYATWLNITGELSPEAEVNRALESEGPYTRRTARKAERAYREAIAEAFEGTGIILAGSQFIGPANKSVEWEDLAAAIKTVDFWTIIERAVEDTECEGHPTLGDTTAYCDGSCR